MTKIQASEFINAVKILRDAVSDDVAEKAAAAFPELKNNGAPIKFGERYRFNGELYKAVADIKDFDYNNPERKPIFWVKL
jgi:hypothetical protein